MAEWLLAGENNVLSVAVECGAMAERLLAGGNRRNSEIVASSGMNLTLHHEVTALIKAIHRK